MHFLHVSVISNVYKHIWEIDSNHDPYYDTVMMIVINYLCTNNNIVRLGIRFYKNVKFKKCQQMCHLPLNLCEHVQFEAF